MKANGDEQRNPNYCGFFMQKGNHRIWCGYGINHTGPCSFEKGDDKYQENITRPIEKQIFSGGAAATKIPGFKYIPLCALERLAKRFELGLERHGANSWNALNPASATMLDDREWLIERLSHIIHHCYKEIERLSSHNKQIEGLDDNAAAIMWGGACLIAADERRKQNDPQQAGKSSTQK